MVDIGITVYLDGAKQSVPTTPGNGQQGTPANNRAFSGTIFKNQFLSTDFLYNFGSTSTYKINGLVNLPIPVTTYYSLTAKLLSGGREYWTDITPSLINSPSGASAYTASTLTILGSFNITGSIALPTISSTYPANINKNINTAIAIYGTNFEAGITVKINGLSATNVILISSKVIYCITPIMPSFGSATIIVKNTNGHDTGLTGVGAINFPVNPVITSITPTSALIGASITDLHGTGFLPGATITFGGVAATNVTYVTSTQLTCTVPSSPIGLVNVVVTNPTGQTTGTSGNGIFTAMFSPASLDLTSWLSGNYSGMPWVGTASAGTSGSANETNYSAGLDPIVGPTLNGHASASYNGSTQRSKLLKTGGSAVVDDFITTTSYTLSTLIYFPSAPAFTPTTPYDHTIILCADARWGVGFSAGGITVWHYNGTFPQLTLACSTGAWHLVDVRYDGAIVSIRVDGGSWTTGAIAQSQIGLTAWTSINSYTEAGGGAMYMMERITSKLQLTDNDLNNYRSYINTRYGTSF